MRPLAGVVCLPVGSQRLNIRRQFRLYDVALGEIAKAMRAKYPDMSAIDIGANVGDTAALIRQSENIPVLCIEGDPQLLPILKENVSRMGAAVEIEPCFVGADGQSIDPGLISDPGINASLVHAVSDSGKVKLRSLRSILKDRPTFASAKLLKSDTEGFDFDIVQQSRDFIRQARPVVFIEYAPNFKPDQPDIGLDAMRALIDDGYTHFIYYDCFGNLLLHVSAEQWDVMQDLHHYLASNQKNGSAVHYFDVCAFHAEDADIALKIQ